MPCRLICMLGNTILSFALICWGKGDSLCVPMLVIGH